MEYNPFKHDGDVSVNGTYEEVSVVNCAYIRLYPVSGNATVFINNTDNLPPFILYESTDLENKDGQITSLTVYSSGATTTNIKMIDYPRGEIVRPGL